MREPPDCVVLSELFSSPRGNVSAGRLIQGGRLALLRELPTPVPSALEHAVEYARGVTHPNLLKVLGMATDGHRRFIATEYLPGVSLLELNAATRRRQQGMDPAAAIRLMLGALARVVDTRELLATRGAPPARLLHSDSVWIAEFGEAMLMEALVSSRLGPAKPQALGAEVELEDVRAAAVELFQLTSGRLMTGDIGATVRRHLPAPLASLIEAAFAWDSASELTTPRGFIRALLGLPGTLIGSEQAVADELQRLVPELLDERHRKLASREMAPRDLEGPTRVYSVVDAERARDETYESEEETMQRPGPVRSASLKPVAEGPPAPSIPRSAAGKGTARVIPAARPPAEAPRAVVAVPLPIAPASAKPSSSDPPRSLLERVLLFVLLVLVVTVIVMALQHPERVAALFGTLGRW